MPAYNSWEYDTMYINPDDNDTKFNIQINILNEAGAKGWEVCGVFPENSLVLVKRPSNGIVPYSGAGTRRKRPERIERPTQATVRRDE
jgi:hypothetical protein